ncbi:MAG: hypothetical protein HOA95_00285, partial [Planctomycetes bacterium]|nr:hypothetical protein [Planctomycetota bacterium]
MSPISCHTSRMLQWNLQATFIWRRRTRFSGLLGFGWLLGFCVWASLSATSELNAQSGDSLQSAQNNANLDSHSD